MLAQEHAQDALVLGVILFFCEEATSGSGGVCAWESGCAEKR